MIKLWKKTDKLKGLRCKKDIFVKKLWSKVKKKNKIKLIKSFLIFKFRKAREKYENDLYLAFIKEKEILENQIKEKKATESA